MVGGEGSGAGDRSLCSAIGLIVGRGMARMVWKMVEVAEIEWLVVAGRPGGQRQVEGYGKKQVDAWQVAEDG